jgi:vacuolar protein sorting-associated protein 45
MLFALRYQKTQTANIANLINLMLSREDVKVRCNADFSQDFTNILSKLVYVLLNVAGAYQRPDDLFSTESLLAKGRFALKGLKVRRRAIFCHIFSFSNSGSRECLYSTYSSSTTISSN